MRTHARTCAYGSCVSCVFRTRTIRTIRAYFVRIVRIKYARIVRIVRARAYFVRILCVFCTRTIRTIVRTHARTYAHESCVSCAYKIRTKYARNTHEIRTEYARNTHDENIKCSLDFRKKITEIVSPPSPYKKRYTLPYSPPLYPPS